MEVHMEREECVRRAKMILSLFAATWTTGLGGSDSGTRRILGHPKVKYIPLPAQGFNDLGPNADTTRVG